jgi:membrane protein
LKHLRLFVDVYQRFSDDAGSFLAGTISYYALLSIFPLLLLAISAAGFFLTEPNVTADILHYTKQALPQYHEVVRDNVRSISANRQSTGIVGLLGLLWIGTAVFDAITYVMNHVWNVQNARHFILSKLLSVAGAIVVVLLLLLTTVISTLFEAMQAFWQQTFNVTPPLEAFRLAAVLIVPAVIFATLLIIYAVIPNIQLGFRDVWVGAAFTTVTLEAAKRLFVVYTSHVARFNAVYGSIGAIVGLLFWLYIMAVILILGAEINAALKAGREQGREAR